MRVLEILLLGVLMITLGNAVYTDCKMSIIKNSLVVKACIAAMVLDAIYYGFYAKDYLKLFLTNMLMITVIALLFYIYHLWAAGDSKLIFAVGLCIPGRIYSDWNVGPVASFYILVFLFSFAFIYIVAESICLGIKRKNLFQIELGKVDYWGMVLSYFFVVASVILFNWLSIMVFGDVLRENRALAMAVHFFVILSLIQIRRKISRKALLIVTLAGWSMVMVSVLAKGWSFHGSVDISLWIFVIAVIFVRTLSEKYNYQVIPTSTVKEGQILAAATVIGFTASRVQGLPTSSTEDLESRLTKQQVESIKKWEKSKRGKPYIIIVRKIPFAIFIALGTCAFLVLGVVLK